MSHHRHCWWLGIGYRGDFREVRRAWDRQGLSHSERYVTVVWGKAGPRFFFDVHRPRTVHQTASWAYYGLEGVLWGWLWPYNNVYKIPNDGCIIENIRKTTSVWLVWLVWLVWSQIGQDCQNLSEIQICQKFIRISKQFHIYLFSQKFQNARTASFSKFQWCLKLI